MAIRFIIGRGIGFNPAGVRYICSQGFSLLPPGPPSHAGIATQGFGLGARVAIRGFGSAPQRTNMLTPLSATAAGDGETFSGGAG